MTQLGSGSNRQLVIATHAKGDDGLILCKRHKFMTVDFHCCHVCFGWLSSTVGATFVCFLVHVFVDRLLHHDITNSHFSWKLV